MLLTIDQLKETNLKGFKFYEVERGYTRTARNGDTFTEYVILYDDGEDVTFKTLSGRMERTMTKDKACVMISERPIFKMVNDEVFNDIDKNL